MEQPTPRRLKLEVNVPEAWAMRAVQAGASPSELAEQILAATDPMTWRAGAGSRTEDVEAAGPVAEAVGVHREPLPPTYRAWTESEFNRYLNVSARALDFFEPLALLSSYIKQGPTPTSAQLKEMARFQDELHWQKALRAAKARLTIQARRMRLPTFFPRAQASDASRYHPMDPMVYGWLIEWNDENPGQLPDPAYWGPDFEHKYAATKDSQLSKEVDA